LSVVNQLKQHCRMKQLAAWFGLRWRYASSRTHAGAN